MKKERIEWKIYNTKGGRQTEKRFTVEKNDKCIRILDNGETIGNTYHVVGLLNAQYEENIELKHDNKRLVKFIMSKGYNLKDYIDWLKKEVWE